jgi:hypothetical protein
VTGRLFVPKHDLSGFVTLWFKITDAARTASARDRFYRVKFAYYQSLAERGMPGTAWFRRQAELASLELPRATRPSLRPLTASQPGIDGTFALFSGSRAISENLQLDRRLEVSETGAGGAELSNVRGIDVPTIDWQPLIEGKAPSLDPLAQSIPADQHAVFFPSFEALTKVADELDRRGTLIARWIEPRAENELVKERYQRQLGLRLSALARLVGPRLVSSVALTGSDPYFFTGTDIALVFETDQPDILKARLIGQALTAAERGAAGVTDGEIGGVGFWGRRSDDRTVSSYIAQLSDVVVVTNSPSQLARLIDVAQGRTPAIASLKEYVFFRDRYPRGAEEETAMIFLSDATIRRWCGPRWRIADSRRTRDRAWLTSLQAAHFDEFANETSAAKQVKADGMPERLGVVRLTPKGIRSSTTGALDFQTPILEMPMEKATYSEINAYSRWRNGYQNNWSGKFDPIALRLGITDKQWSADLTVMPLIGSSQYRWYAEALRGLSLTADTADPHDTIMEFLHACDFDRPLGQRTGFGRTVSVWCGKGPFWDERTTVSPKDLLEHLDRLPFGLYIAVESREEAATTLTKLRFIVDLLLRESTREELTYDGRPYIVFRPKSDEIEEWSGFKPVPMYYTLAEDGFFVTFNQAMLQAYIDRQNARGTGIGTAIAARRTWPLLGEHMALHADRDGLAILNRLSTNDYQSQMQLRSWANVPILNEWRRHYPDRDPLELYERYWQARLECPGGGDYVWNEEWQTMESTVFGHPAQPKPGPDLVPWLSEFADVNFGLTFELNGLRARAVIDRYVD